MRTLQNYSIFYIHIIYTHIHAQCHVVHVQSRPLLHTCIYHGSRLVYLRNELECSLCSLVRMLISDGKQFRRENSGNEESKKQEPGYGQVGNILPGGGEGEGIEVKTMFNGMNQNEGIAACT